MWEAVVAVIGLFAAGLGYYLKRAADSPVEKATQLENDLRTTKAAIARLEREASALRLLNLQANKEVVRLRRELYKRSSASDIADRLRKPTP